MDKLRRYGLFAIMDLIPEASCRIRRIAAVSLFTVVSGAVENIADTGQFTSHRSGRMRKRYRLPRLS